MKIVLVIFGTLGGIYAIFGVIRFIAVVMSSNPSSTYGATNIVTSFVPIVLGLILCLACFQRAFRRPN